MDSSLIKRIERINQTEEELDEFVLSNAQEKMKEY